MAVVKQHKKQKLRNAEYYDMQKALDRLYADSKAGKSFHALMPLVLSEENILMAYRNIRKNKGSKTAGTDGKSIGYFAKFTDEALVRYIRKRLAQYAPQPVKRVEIPKGDTGENTTIGNTHDCR